MDKVNTFKIKNKSILPFLSRELNSIWGDRVLFNSPSPTPHFLQIPFG